MVGSSHECHDESTCPLTLLFGHPVFLRAYVEMTAEDDWPPERLAELVLAFLGMSPLETTDKIRARVHACSDPDRLRAWALRAPFATNLTGLFGEDSLSD